MSKHIWILAAVLGFLALLVIGIFISRKSNLNFSQTPVSTPSSLESLTNVGSSPEINLGTPSAEQSNLLYAKNKNVGKFPAVLTKAELSNKKVVLLTKKGQIEFEIFTDAPKAASNFIHLAQNGFYDELTFHRVVPGFVIQGGDPVGNGTGGPGYKFEDEPVTKDYKKGIVAYANSGPDTNGSQFFIMLEDNLSLPKNYTIFGQVIAGQDVVDSIVVGDKMEKVTIEDLR